MVNSSRSALAIAPKVELSHPTHHAGVPFGWFAEIEKLRGGKEQKKTREATKMTTVQLHRNGQRAIATACCRER